MIGNTILQNKICKHLLSNKNLTIRQITQCSIYKGTNITNSKKDALFWAKQLEGWKTLIKKCTGIAYHIDHCDLQMYSTMHLGE